MSSGHFKGVFKETSLSVSRSDLTSWHYRHKPTSFWSCYFTEGPGGRLLLGRPYSLLPTPHHVLLSGTKMHHMQCDLVQAQAEKLGMHVFTHAFLASPLLFWCNVCKRRPRYKQFIRLTRRILRLTERLWCRQLCIRETVVVCGPPSLWPKILKTRSLTSRTMLRASCSKKKSEEIKVLIPLFYFLFCVRFLTKSKLVFGVQQPSATFLVTVAKLWLSFDDCYSLWKYVPFWWFGPYVS